MGVPENSHFPAMPLFPCHVTLFLSCHIFPTMSHFFSHVTLFFCNVTHFLPHHTFPAMSPFSAMSHLFLSCHTCHTFTDGPVPHNWNENGNEIGGLYLAPQISAGFRSFRRNKIWQRALPNWNSRDKLFRQNWAILVLRPECSPECTGTECNRNPVPGIHNK